MFSPLFKDDGLIIVKIFENRCIYFRFLFGKMVREAKSKFRSIKRKRRKGFHGRRPAELQKERDDRQCTHDPPGPSSSSLQVLDDKAPISSSSPCKENVSVKKLHYSSFEKIEREKGILTREKAKHVGAASSFQVQRAVGFKLQMPCFWMNVFLPLQFVVYVDRHAPNFNYTKEMTRVKVCPNLCF